MPKKKSMMKNCRQLVRDQREIEAESSGLSRGSFRRSGSSRISMHSSRGRRCTCFSSITTTFSSGSGSGSDRSGDIRLLLSLRISGCGGTGRKALKGSGSLSPERGDRDLDRVVRPLKDVVLVKAVGQEAVELEEKSRSAGATRRSATNAVAGVR